MNIQKWSGEIVKAVNTLGMKFCWIACKDTTSISKSLRFSTFFSKQLFKNILLVRKACNTYTPAVLREQDLCNCKLMAVKKDLYGFFPLAFPIFICNHRAAVINNKHFFWGNEVLWLHLRYLNHHYWARSPIGLTVTIPEPSWSTGAVYVRAFGENNLCNLILVPQRLFT